MDIDHDKSILNLTANFTVLPNDSSEFSFLAHLHVELKAFVVQIGIAFPSANGKFEKPIQTFADVCKYFKNNNGNMFLKIFFNGSFRNRTFPSTCPVKPGFYFMEGFHVNDNFLRMNFLETKFMTTLNVCTKIRGKLKCFSKSTLFGEIRDRQKWERENAAKKN